MQKGASNTELKKSAPPDDDFGKDFFDSWKSEKLGNESMDFDMETVPKNKKASFKFDELDNFELSGNFDKLSSFKLDVPDLDFPGLSKKIEKTHEKSSKEFVPGKKESKENKFSFDFDFNNFDIASKSTEERSSNLSDKKVQERSSKLETNQVSTSNISTSTNISRDRHSDFARKTEVFLGKKNVIAEDNEKETTVTLASHEKYLPTENSDNDQNVCLRTSSDDGSADVALHGIQTDNATLDVVKLRTKIERTDAMHLISSSPSRSSSPVYSYNSVYLTKPSGKELTNPGSEIQKHQSRDPLTRICGSLTDSFQIRKEVHDSTGTKRSVEGFKDMDEKQYSCKNRIPPNKQSSLQNLMRPSVKREFTAGGSSKLSRLMNTDFQLNNISKLGSRIPQQSPAFMSKPLESMLEARTKGTHATTSNDSSLQFKTSSASHQPSIGAKSIVGSTLQKLSTDATVDPKVSPAGYNMTSIKENSKPKLVSSTRLGSQNISTDKDISLDDNSHRGILNSTIAKTIEANNNKTNSSKPRETKSMHFLEKKMECPLNAVNSANIEKHVSLHAPLKRKIDEGQRSMIGSQQAASVYEDPVSSQWPAGGAKGLLDASENHTRQVARPPDSASEL
ncbi:hypothetical protein KSP39_PZI005250 [Platanthera zijinensis]|uniref:Uncharacterized protein n=1 Tax=Platanthera zijinensis TaxID=2320716 RepID=A0AAP0GB04_9ASPA